MSAVRASVVLPSHNEGDRVVDTVACIVSNTRLPDIEVIVVDDGSSDGSPERLRSRFGDGGPLRVLHGNGLGVVGARNLGAREARGEVVVFLDAHCYVHPGWLEGLVQALERPEVGMVGPAVGSFSHHPGLLGYGVSFVDATLRTRWLPRLHTEPYSVPLLCGCCQAFRRELFLAIGGFDSGMPRWGSEDLEIGLRLYLLGYEVQVVPSSVIHHLFRESHPYEVAHAVILHNLLRMAILHLGRERFGRVVAGYRRFDGFDDGWRMLAESDAFAVRERLAATRRRDDDWYCRRFGLRL